MQPNVIEEVLGRNFDSLTSLEDVAQAITYLTSAFGEKIPLEAIQDVTYRLNSNPESLSYAKQQLRYLVNWVN